MEPCRAPCWASDLRDDCSCGHHRAVGWLDGIGRGKCQPRVSRCRSRRHVIAARWRAQRRSQCNHCTRRLHHCGQRQHYARGQLGQSGQLYRGHRCGQLCRCAPACASTSALIGSTPFATLSFVSTSGKRYNFAVGSTQSITTQFTATGAPRSHSGRKAGCPDNSLLST